MSTKKDALVLLAAAGVGLLACPDDWQWYRALVAILALLALMDAVS